MNSLLPQKVYSNFISNFLLCAFFMGISAPKVAGQNAYEEGKRFYNQRAAGTTTYRANPKNINRAINAFERARQEGIKPRKTATYLLKAYYFKAMFVELPEGTEQSLYSKGRTLGKTILQRYPDSVPIKFWYSAHIGRWAAVHGFIRAATNGISKKLRRICKDIIARTPEYQGGGGYRILAQVHFYSPNIPILMGWPSDDKAKKLIEKAMSIAPNHPTNRLLYARVLLEFDQYIKAKQQLKYILNMNIRDEYKIEDRYVKHHSRELLNKHF